MAKRERVPKDVGVLASCAFGAIYNKTYNSISEAVEDMGTTRKTLLDKIASGEPILVRGIRFYVDWIDLRYLQIPKS